MSCSLQSALRSKQSYQAQSQRDDKDRKGEAGFTAKYCSDDFSPATSLPPQDLVEQKKKAVHEGESQSAEKSPRGRDLLSLIGEWYRMESAALTDRGLIVSILTVRANMDPDLKENQRMTDEEVVGQISTFMLGKLPPRKYSVHGVGENTDRWIYD